MKLRDLHSWDASPAEARDLQVRLQELVIRCPLSASVRFVAGVDSSVRGDTIIAAAVLLDWPSLVLVERAVCTLPVRFPYIPGLLSFREIPAIGQALGILVGCADLVFVDGHGVAHPRGFGLACHLGILLDLPTIGVAKSRLVGAHSTVAEGAGSMQALTLNSAMIGMVLRTRERCRPVYVSVGHRVELDSAVAFTTVAVRGHRLPEPLRLAHNTAWGFQRQGVGSA